MNTMIYKGYAASIEYSNDDECFIGYIATAAQVSGQSINQWISQTLYNGFCHPTQVTHYDRSGT